MWRGGVTRHFWMRSSRAHPEAHPESRPGPGRGPTRPPRMECIRGVAGMRGRRLGARGGRVLGARNLLRHLKEGGGVRGMRAARASARVARGTQGGRARGTREGRALGARNSPRHLTEAGGVRVAGRMPVGCGTRVVWADLSAVPLLPSLTQRTALGLMGGAIARRGLRSSAGSSTSAGRSVRCAPNADTYKINPHL